RTPAGTSISGDWPGMVAYRLREEGYGEAIFRLGVCGDIDPVVAWHNFAFEGMELSAELVTQSLLAVLDSVETVPAMNLGLARQDVALPLMPLNDEDIAATLAEVRTSKGPSMVRASGSEE